MSLLELPRPEVLKGPGRARAITQDGTIERKVPPLTTAPHYWTVFRYSFSITVSPFSVSVLLLG